MKTKIVITLITLAAGLSMPAANIAFLSFHPADDTPSANAAAAGFTNAPDAGYTQLLTAKGHRVTRFVTQDAIDGNPDLQTALNTHDLVIISRSVPSSHYADPAETAVYNGLTPPVMVLDGYATRTSQLGFTTGTTMTDLGAYPLRLNISAPGHPIFKDVAISNNVMVNPYARSITYTNPSTGATTAQNGISINNNTIATGGRLLATVASPSTPAGGPVIADFPPGTLFNGRDSAPSERLLFLTGSRESGMTSEGAGMFDLLPDGQKLFLNAVTYLLPSPPQFLYALPSGTNLLTGDTWTFNPGVFGTMPQTYQWYMDSQLLSGATDATLAFPSLDPTNAGSYYVIAENALGRGTSTVATLQFATYAAPSIINGIVAYWPLDTAIGTKTPDLVSSYDMNMANMGQTNIVPGRWGNAFSFNNAASQMLSRKDNPGESLPIYSKSNFTVSFWVLGNPQSDHRIFAEATLTNNNPMFDLGSHNSATSPDGSVDIFIRPLGGTAQPNHAHSIGMALDNNWHHVAYVQRYVGGGQSRAQLFIDGNLDPVSTTFAPIQPVEPETTAIGGLLRGTAGAYFTGLIDEVAVWDRPLSPQEIQILQVTPITNAPSRVAPLKITTFIADLPAVAKGDSVTLRWDISKDVGQVSIDQGIGDVTSITSGGSGSKSVTLDATKTFVLTAVRGADTQRATTKVAVVEGVAPNWTLLDNFDQYTPGDRLKNVGYWNDAAGDSARFVDRGGNTALRTDNGNSVVYLKLGALTVKEGQARTLFFRMIPQNGAATAVTNIIGITDKGQRSYGDEYFNIGPAVYVSPLTNTDYSIDTNAWYLGTRGGGPLGNNTSNPVEFPPNPLQTNHVYNVWIDFTNNPMAAYAPDVFSVYIAKEGDTNRTVVFQDYLSDRDFDWAEAVLGGMHPDLDKVIVLGNNATTSTIVDDFYLSKNGYLSTVPKPDSTGSVGPLPALQVSWSGTQLEIKWTAGILQESSNLTTWTDVTGATAPSFKVSPTGTAKFYRARP